MGDGMGRRKGVAMRDAGPSCVTLAVAVMRDAGPSCVTQGRHA